MDALQKLEDINLEGKRVIVRLDLDVSLDEGTLDDSLRMQKALQTLTKLHEMSARVIVISHIGRESSNSLQPIADYLAHFLPVRFVPQHIYDAADSDGDIGEIAPGEVVLLENMRRYLGEVQDDDELARHLAGLAEIYINDSFATSHRSHASTVGIPRHIPGYLGFTFTKEIENLSKAFSPEHPFFFCLGGAKFETKLPLIQKFLAKADKLLIGGALINNLLKEKGYNIGKSLVSKGDFSLQNVVESDKVIFPVDLVVNTTNGREVKAPDALSDDDVIVDIGPETMKSIEGFVKDASFIVWNGPLGLYEKGFTDATESLAKIVAESSAESVVGGGDTITAITSLGLNEHFRFLSTGGGSALTYLADETLPAIDAVCFSQKKFHVIG
jgi:phosphoglycerate kinase